MSEIASRPSQADVFGDDGVAEIHRRVPLPSTISPEAQRYLVQAARMTPPRRDPPAPLWNAREHVDKVLAAISEQMRKLYPVEVEEIEVAGVRTHLVKPPVVAEEMRGRALISLHGGGFVMGSGSLVEAIPIAHLAQAPVMAVDYALAPEHPFPAARDQVVEVFRAALDYHRPEHIGIFGTSAGGYLAAQAVARIRACGLPNPGAVGLFTCAGDMTRLGDSTAFFTMSGLAGDLAPQPEAPGSHWRAYAGARDLADPELSPQLGDLAGWPPCLLIAGTRDLNLSATSLLHRALRAADVEAELYVFEAMPHAHWVTPGLPEGREALEIQAAFFRKTLTRS